MKNRESFIKLLLLAVIGAMIGVSGNILLRFSGEGIKGIYAEMGAALRHTGWKIESLLILVVMAVLIGIYRHLRSLWAQEEASEDETADLCGEQFERWGSSLPSACPAGRTCGASRCWWTRARSRAGA